jgi:hypothetical protein
MLVGICLRIFKKGTNSKSEPSEMCHNADWSSVTKVSEKRAVLEISVTNFNILKIARRLWWGGG